MADATNTRDRDGLTAIGRLLDELHRVQEIPDDTERAECLHALAARVNAACPIGRTTKDQAAATVVDMRTGILKLYLKSMPSNEAARNLLRDWGYRVGAIVKESIQYKRAPKPHAPLTPMQRATIEAADLGPLRLESCGYIGSDGFIADGTDVLCLVERGYLAIAEIGERGSPVCVVRSGSQMDFLL